jgi:hypothetical protein
MATTAADRQSAMAVSLCYPAGRPASPRGERRPLVDRAADDLGLSALRTRFELPSEFLYELCTDPATIRYRQEVLADAVASSELRKLFAQLQPMLHELAYFTKTRTEQSSPLQQAVWRLGELETYVACLTALAEASALPGMRSAGMRALGEFVRKRQQEEVYRRLEAELPALRGGLKRRASVTIGINLDSQLRPSEATLLRVHERKFEDTPLLSRLFGVSNPFTPLTKVHRTSAMMPLLGELDRVLGTVARPLAKALGQFVQLQVRDVLPLEQEIRFYLGGARMVLALQERGMPTCIPELAPVAERRSQAHELYDVSLALNGAQDEPARTVVRNDLDADELGRIAILTGPNQGGKTTFVRAVGVMHVLAQAGLHVAARTAAISPADRVITHFPAEEGGGIEGGRLAEEARRLGAIFSDASEQSLVLFNESLSSTSPSESLYLAQDVVRALRLLGARAIFATHLHELGERLERINAEVDGGSLVVSLVAGIAADGGGADGAQARMRRTYRIAPGPPVGSSYARDIADRYEISFERLRPKILARRAEQVEARPGDNGR